LKVEWEITVEGLTAFGFSVTLRRLKVRQSARLRQLEDAEEELCPLLLDDDELDEAEGEEHVDEEDDSEDSSVEMEVEDGAGETPRRLVIEVVETCFSIFCSLQSQLIQCSKIRTFGAQRLE